MKLYHGSNVKVRVPSLHYSERKNDLKNPIKNG